MVAHNAVQWFCRVHAVGSGVSLPPAKGPASALPWCKLPEHRGEQLTLERNMHSEASKGKYKIKRRKKNEFSLMQKNRKTPLTPIRKAFTLENP